MARIKKILENNLVGGNSNTEVYPVTSTRAIYNQEGIQLDEILNNLNDTLVSYGRNIHELSSYPVFGGVLLSPSMSNSIPENISEIIYIAIAPGTYKYFDNLNVKVGEVALFRYKDAQWTKTSLGLNPDMLNNLIVNTNIQTDSLNPYTPYSLSDAIFMANKTGVEGPCKIATYTDMDWHAHLAIYDGSGTGPKDESSWVDIDLNNLNQYKAAKFMDLDKQLVFNDDGTVTWTTIN